MSIKGFVTLITQMKQLRHQTGIPKPEHGRAHVQRLPAPAPFHWLVPSLQEPYFSVMVILLFVLFGDVFTPEEQEPLCVGGVWKCTTESQENATVGPYHNQQLSGQG